MPLRTLILLHVIEQNFQAAVYAAVVEIEPIASNLDRLASALVLPGIDPTVEHVEHLVVPAEERLIEYLRISPIDFHL